MRLRPPARHKHKAVRQESPMQALDCIFCKILSGKIPARTVAQNDNAVAILDAFPLVPGHALVMPKAHFAKVQDASPEQSRDVFELVGRVAAAIESGLGAEGSLVAIHNGRAAGQEIPHLHVHIIPRKEGDGAGPVHTMFRSRKKVEPSEMDSILHRISSLAGKGSQ